MTKSFVNCLKVLTSSSKFHISLGLERISMILELLGNPQNNLKIIHVAGTNGKGSTCAILSSVLSNCTQESDLKQFNGEKTLKVGLFTSPHIKNYTERIKINGVDIDEKAFGQLFFEVQELAEKNKIALTEFEILTAMMYLHFFRENVDIAIVEVGLGGRFDATNVVERPCLSIITSISLDHTERLGVNVEKIAFEKAGVVKSGCLVVIDEKNQGFKTVAAVAEKLGASILTPKTKDVNVKITKSGALINGRAYNFPLLGLHQKYNLELAITALEHLDISKESIGKGLENVDWKCRMQFFKNRNIIIDGAHNADGARVLKESLDFYFKDIKRIFIYGSLNNKNYKEISEILFNKNDEVYIYEFNSPNALKYKDFCSQTRIDAQKICNEEIKKIIAKEGLKIITGSFYMFGEILNVLDIPDIISE